MTARASLAAVSAAPRYGLTPAVAGAEIFDPAANNGAGAWTPTLAMGQARGGHSATGLDGPACRATVAPPASPPAWCGAVLVAGGTPGGYGDTTAGAELYTPSPTVGSVTPTGGQLGGSTPVTIDGSGFTGATTVRFGDTAAVIVSQTPTQIVVSSPGPHPVGAVTVTVTAAGGSSATIDANPGAVFNYEDTPGPVGALTAQATSDQAVTLSFTAAAASSAASAPPVTRYVIRQSATPITDANFGSATTLCPGPDGACGLAPAAVGAPLRIDVGGLSPGGTYWFAVAALNDAGLTGPVVATSATTAAAGCAPAPPAGPGQVAFGAGYSLVGLPGGTVVDAGSPLYGWTDAGAGGAYQVLGPQAPVASGRGYWAWFACGRNVTFSPGPAGAHLRLHLGGYHASMVGNPTTKPVTVSGFDYAARWDPASNAYHLSAYRQSQTLAVGQGIWVFSYRAATVNIDG